MTNDHENLELIELGTVSEDTLGEGASQIEAFTLMPNAGLSRD